MGVQPARLVACCVALALGLFAGASMPAFAQKQGGTLRVLHRDNPPSASIHEEATISTVMPFSGVFNNLVVFDVARDPQNRAENIIPELATEWAWSADNRRLTMKLRQGVRWHDGKDFTSEDVKCTWEQLIGARDIGLRKNPRKTWYFNLKGVETNGAHEVTFVLGEPQPSLLTMLAGGMSPVYPCHVNGAQMRTKPVGTGPFRFAEFKQNEGMRITRNPDYWRPGRPYLDAIEWTIITNRATQVLALQTGRFDLSFAADWPVHIGDEIKAQVPSLICAPQTTNTMGNLLVNRDSPPFNNPDIRRAMNLVIDRQAFIDTLMRGGGRVGAMMLPPPEGVWGMPASELAQVEGYEPDMEARRAKAKALMAKLGYSATNTLKIKVATRNIPAYRDPAVLFIDHLRHAFIEGELEPLDTSVWYARLIKKDYQVGWNTQGVGIDDPDVVLFENFACGSERNYTAYCDKDTTALLLKQSQMLDFTARRKLVWEIDRRLQEDGARPVVLHNMNTTCWWPQVKGVHVSNNSIYNNWRFESVWLDR